MYVRKPTCTGSVSCVAHSDEKRRRRCEAFWAVMGGFAPENPSFAGGTGALRAARVLSETGNSTAGCPTGPREPSQGATSEQPDPRNPPSWVPSPAEVGFFGVSPGFPAGVSTLSPASAQKRGTPGPVIGERYAPGSVILSERSESKDLRAGKRTANHIAPSACEWPAVPAASPGPGGPSGLRLPLAAPAASACPRRPQQPRRPLPSPAKNPVRWESSIFCQESAHLRKPRVKKQVICERQALFSWHTVPNFPKIALI